MDSNFWYKLLQDIIVLAVTAIAPALFALIVVIIKKKYAEFKSYANDYGWDLDQIANMAVKAAEEAKFAGLIEDKMAYALDIAQKQLDKKGIKIDLAVIKAAIEAAVYSEMNKDKIAEAKEVE